MLISTFLKKIFASPQKKEASKETLMQALEKTGLVSNQKVREAKGHAPIAKFSGITLNGTTAWISITATPKNAQKLETTCRTLEKALTDLPHIEKATVVLTAQKEPSATGPTPATRPQNPASHPSTSPASPAGHRPINVKPSKNNGLANVKHIIAVASGKGGVGKSTVAVNLALALEQQGLNIGLLDADIYGPSQTRMTGINNEQLQQKDKILTPIEKFNLKIMSMGLMVNEQDPIVWRGPMVIGAIKQLLNDVAWGPLDVLVVDMPPGTGDTQLSLSQNTKLSGAIIVSTPQDIALIDALKGLNMFKKVNVPILGLVENMSVWTCPHCGEPSYPFGKEGLEKISKDFNLPILARLPLDLKVREGGDNGRPIFLEKGPYQKYFRDIATGIIRALHLKNEKQESV